jgi:hypothetical protein
MSDPRAAVDNALERAATWLLSMQIRPGVFRMSAAHDPERWPGPLLVGSYDAVMALGLIGRLDAVDRQAATAFLAQHRQADGQFANPQMRPEDCFKKPDPEETRRYIAFHLTNYSLGALEMLKALDPLELRFLRPFLEIETLEAWLARRDQRDPWQEGNNIVNLASFLLLAHERGEAKAMPCLQALIDWHHRNQEPATGYWAVGQTVSAERHLHAMAGATHNLHLFYALDEPVPCHQPMVDHCLSLPTESVSACLDVDPVDILVHLDSRYGYRHEAMQQWLEAKLTSILATQNNDGGFPDTRSGRRKLDGWFGGYAEQQGLSNTFGTYFRLIAIAMIADALWPGWRRFRFRKMLGIGYRKEQTGERA